MKIAKMLCLALAMTMGFGLQANSATLDDETAATGFYGDVKLGRTAGAAGFGIGIGYQKQVYNYLSWDVASVEYSAPFDSPGDLSYINVKTGVRGYSPTFCKKLRAYSNLDMGYSMAIMKTLYYDPIHDIWGTSNETGHGFGLSFGIGLQINKKFSLGYALQYSTATPVSTKCHFANFGIAF